MALGNLSGVGYVCVGIEETQMQEMLPGLGTDQFDEWTNFDDVSAALAKYSDPPSRSTSTRAPCPLAQRSLCSRWASSTTSLTYASGTSSVSPLIGGPVGV